MDRLYKHHGIGDLCYVGIVLNDIGLAQLAT